MATMEAIEGKSDEAAEPLPNVSPLDKIIVAFAGPLASFGLAVFFAFIVWGVGKPDNARERQHRHRRGDRRPRRQGRAAARATPFWRWTGIR